PRCVIQPHALIRRYAAIGPFCKVAGEVSFSILQGYVNKGHSGFLGHAVIGAWCNFGAGTTASNLKNTYGHVRLQLAGDAAPIDTARMFHGPVMGDFVRTAIVTRLSTGTVLGTGCMIATSGFAPRFAAPFG